MGSSLRPVRVRNHDDFPTDEKIQTKGKKTRNGLESRVHMDS